MKISARYLGICISRSGLIITRMAPLPPYSYCCCAFYCLPLSKNSRGRMINLTNVTYLYQHLPMRFDLSVAMGERVAILGPSGAGKSTLLSLIAGFLPLHSGNILLNGVDHSTTPPARRPVSMLFQENNLFAHLSVEQNIGLG